jgi:acyl transferase domain-containing protein/surfactin synthase thioesterase subunit/NADPH:quinone reductase-like Zn-dependent oxidoreductase/acyl carrier protein
MSQSSSRVRTQSEPLAIVGMSCRFPGGATSLERYWSLMRDGVDAIAEIPADRWDRDALFSLDREKRGRTYIKWGGFLEGIDLFDPEFFGISPREAAHIDPQQRLLLEVAYESLEHAGIPLEGLRGSRTGVFVGLFIHDYAHIQLFDRDAIDAYTGTGTSMSIAANRISYLYDLRGPSVALDTACSSSLVALHQGCESLRTGACDMVLAGGVNTILRPEMTIAMSKASMLSPDGRCHSFDAEANGYVRAEGAGMVVLKRLVDAERDGDVIHAVIRSTAVNQDGRTKGISVPSGEAQSALLREAATLAGVAPADIQFVEAHGTGTPVGDPIEANALGEVLSEGRDPNVPCVLGSIKANIGHTESASGIAGLIKVVLALKHRQIPPNLHFKKPNSAIDLAALGLRVPTSLEPWPETKGGPRLACLNSFGFGGTNAHAILEEGPSTGIDKREPVPQAPKPQLVPLSSHSETGLLEAAGRLRDFCRASDVDLRDIIYTAGARRTHHSKRLALIAADRTELAELLDAYCRGEARREIVATEDAVRRVDQPVFVFTGMGPQWWKMGRELLEEEPIFREAVEEIDVLLRERAGWSVIEELTRPEEESRIQETKIAQPGIFAVQVGLYRLWCSWGVKPAAIMGHSVGEAAAAYAAGALSLVDAVAVVETRSRLQHRTEGQGRMLAVGLSEQEARDLIGGQEHLVSVAAINSPTSISLAGNEDVLVSIEKQLRAADRFARFLEVPVPYHSPAMDPLQTELISTLQGIEPRMSEVAYYSTIRGVRARGDELGPDYWWNNVRDTVLFKAAMDLLLVDGFDTFIEVGPHPVLARSIEECLGDRPGVSLPSLRRKMPERGTLMSSLGMLYCLGYPVKWEKLSVPCPPCELPSYAWQRQRYWDESRESEARRRGAGDQMMLTEGGARHPLLGSKLALTQDAFGSELSDLRYVQDHRVRGAAVYPGAAYLEMSIAAAANIFGASACVLRDVRFETALYVDSQTSLRLQTTIENGSLQIVSREAGVKSWTRHMETVLVPGAPRPDSGERFDREALTRGFTEVLDSAMVYPLFLDIGLEYGPAFQGISKVWRGDREIVAKIETPASIAQDLGEYYFHPALLDACLHSLFCTLTIDGQDADMRGDVYLPVSISEFRFVKQPAGTLYVHCTLTSKILDESFVGNIHIYDEEGLLVARAEGLKCRNLNRSDAVVSEKLERMRYAYRWDEAALGARDRGADVEGAFASPKTFVLFGDRSGPSTRVAEVLKRREKRVVQVMPGSEFIRRGDERFEIDLSNPEHFTRLFEEVAPANEAVGAIYLSALDIPRSPVDPETSHILAYGGPLHLVQALSRLAQHGSRVWFVTSGVESVVSDDTEIHPFQAPLWGLSRVAGNEHSELKATVIDLAAEYAPSEVDALLEEVLHSGDEDEIALRGTRRYVHRFSPAEPIEVAPKPGVGEEVHFELEMERRGSLDDLKWREVRPAELGSSEIEIAVAAVGLNFKDVMKASGLLPQSVMEGNFWRRALGMECSGVVSRIGKDVTQFSVGDRVVGFAHHAFRSHVTTEACLVSRMPETLGFEEAATIPLAFVTAYYALHDQGQLRAGQKVLIHAASGGVGQAALMLARRAGATVYGTAGSEAKREFVRACGAELVCDSRSLSFADEILRNTGGRGVDLILNSLAGEAIDRNLDVLSDFGRLLELGKVDIDRNHKLGMRPLDRNASLHGIDLDRLLAQRPQEAGRLLREVMALFEVGELKPLRWEAFPSHRVSEAFRHMATASHIGKVVVTTDRTHLVVARSSIPAFDSNGTYVVTGGFGGFGLELLKWLVEHGARHIAVLSRSGKNTALAEQAVASLEAMGATIVDMKLDVGDIQAVGDCLSRIKREQPPIKGVFHAAAVLSDDLLRNQTLQKYRDVAASKLQGAWALHQHTLDQPLDQFVLFSSVTSVLGNHGSANYVAANAFVDALAHYRRKRAMPALTVNWGLIADVGMAQKEPEVRRHLESNGLVALHTRLGLYLLGVELERGSTQITLAPVAWTRWLKFHQKQTAPRFSAVAGRSEREERRETGKLDLEFVSQLVEALPEQREEIARAAIRKRVASVFGAAPEKIDVGREFTSLGLDSLMALELRSRLEELGVAIPVSTLLEGGTVQSLVTPVMNKHLSGDEGRPSSATDSTPRPEGAALTEATFVRGKWVVTPAPHPAPRARLICFPYAGGAPTAFHDWSEELPSDTEVSAINLPGRARRIKEPARGSIHEMAREIVPELLPLLDRPFAFFGHCMGSIIMYEVAQLLQSEHGLSPMRLFVGGSMAPHLYQSSLVYIQPDPKFMDVLKLLDFTNTSAMLADEEMRGLLMPTLRADFEAVVNYSRDFEKRPRLACPVTSFAAKKDLFAAPSSMVFWKDYSEKECELSMLDVHHYFVETHKTFLTKKIAAQMAQDLGSDDAPRLAAALEPMQAMAEPIALYQDDAQSAELGTDLNAQEWLDLHPSRGKARMRLYCMPSALGRHPAEAFLYTRIAEHAEICLVRTPVWGGKAPSLMAQAHALARVLFEDAQAGRFALFGHCSGAILMYEVARKLAEWGGPRPDHLFASSAGAPHLYVMPNAHLLGDEKLLDVLDVIGHPLTDELRKDPELRRELIPQYRADFEMMSSHQHRDGELLSCPITVIRARNDLWTFFYGAEHWSEHTTGPFEILTDEEGDHFHIEREPELAVDVITRALGWGRGSHARVRNDFAGEGYLETASPGKR